MKCLKFAVPVSLLLWAAIIAAAVFACSCTNYCKVTKSRPMGYTYKTK